MKVTLGGKRLGSGGQMQEELRHYEMSTFNRDRTVKTAMSCGTLVPCYCDVGLKSDTWDIDLDAMVRTIPTNGPLFGSFKFQIDFFECPFRLYQGILHNNPMQIGLQMAKVKLPKLKIKHTEQINTEYENDFCQIAPNALLKYLGLSGIGRAPLNNAYSPGLYRKVLAVPVLAYYDIFKNYYANKQETNAYVITGDEFSTDTTFKNVEGLTRNGTIVNYTETVIDDATMYDAVYNTSEVIKKVILYGENLDPAECDIFFGVYDSVDGWEWTQQDDLENNGYFDYTVYTDRIEVRAKNANMPLNNFRWTYALDETPTTHYETKIVLDSFALDNIDTMRQRLLSSNTLNSEFVIDETFDMKPYNLLTKQRTNGQSANTYLQNGLVVKTYQSDVFNNWLNTEWIDGENGIAAITAIDTSDGNFKLDVLNLSQKVYNMLNRIAVSGGTYYDWLEAVYDEEVVHLCEIPKYIGGMSSEIAFEEVVSTSESNVDGKDSKIGTLAGKGTLVGKKAGNIHIHLTEPGFIIGICSITPRISYHQGNDWYMTELDTMDDLHKPELDEIGFQEFITERAAWWDTIISIPKANPSQYAIIKNSAGKQPAWIEYQTDYDRVYSNFADNDKEGFMVLKRDYKFAPTLGTDSAIQDMTTYIDPTKFNYAFAYQKLDAQNFWVQIKCHNTPRRKMSSRNIPIM